MFDIADGNMLAMCFGMACVLNTNQQPVFCQGVFDKTVGNMRAMCFVLKQQPPLHLCPNMGAAEKKEASVTWGLMNISNSIQKYFQLNPKYFQLNPKYF